jgi:type I restriction enzyme S subunit
MNAKRLLAHYLQIADAPDAISRLRRFMLDLAVRGKLVPQDQNDETAAELLKRIAAEKARLVKAGEARKSEIDPVIPEKAPFFIPTNWVWTRLGSIGDWGSGSTPPRGNSDLYGGGISWLKSGELNDNRALAGSEETVTQLAIEKGSFRLNKPGDVLLAMYGATIGKVAILAENAVTNQAVCGCTPFAGIDNQFLFLFLVSQREQFHSASEGGAQPNISKVKIVWTPFPLPPLAEQRRIVAKVDELMGLCDRLEAARAEREATRDQLAASSLARLNAPDPENFQTDARFVLDALPTLTTRPDQIKALRQTILNLAVRGRLVPQDPNDKPAAELLKRIATEKARLGMKNHLAPLKSDEIPYTLPTGWSWSRIGEICSKTGSGSTPRGGKEVYKAFGVPFLRSQNIYDDGLRLNDVAYIDPATHKRMSGTSVMPGDLLLNITGGSMGRCCLVPSDFKEANISQHVAIIRVALQGIERFLHRLVLSPYFQAFVFDEQTGAGRGGLPKNRMDLIAVALPPLAEQHRIVSKVEELMALCDRLEASLSATTATRRRLLDALLAEALTPVDGREMEAAE